MPAAVAWPLPGMLCTSLAGPHLCASLGQCLHRADADVGLLRVLWSGDVLWYQSHQRTFGATVGLFWWQLNLNNVSFRHFYFLLSGDFDSNVISVSYVQGIFRPIPIYTDLGKNRQ